MIVEVLITVSFVIIIFHKLWTKVNENYYVLSLCKRLRTVDGSPLESKIYVTPTKTRFGNNFDLVNFTPESIFNFVRNTSAEAKGRNYLWYFFHAPMYNVVRAEDAEEIFQSPKLITKNMIYNLLKPFLGEGLLTSSDQKWHARRKALTPAFHFNVLQSFLVIFNVGKELDLNQVIPQFTLNNICVAETALGVKLDNMTEGIRYRRSIHAIEEVMQQRLSNPFFYNIVYFFIFGDYRKQVDNLKIAHDFSSNIIEKRRSLFKSKQLGQMDEFGQKQRYAMLDTLLAAEAEGQIDHQGICDEVNTFMFEGYDTTSTCLIFTLLMLALHEDVQNRCYEELEHLPEDSNEISLFQFNELFYLECVIKESLRMFPSVPSIGRKCVEEGVVNGLIMPKDTQINIHLYDIMRDPRHFPSPHVYNPDRFLPENTVNRLPFAFVPFSAGQRNCIGQKFAILEIKVLLAAVIKKFKLIPITYLNDLTFENGMVLRTKQNVKVKLVSRKTIFNFIRESTAKAKGQNYLWYFLFAPEYNIVRAEDAEEIFQSTKITTKNMAYNLIKPFLGNGLLISTETALGVKLDDLSEGNEYRKAIHEFEEVFNQRVCNPLLYYNWFFFLFGDYRKHSKILRIIHDFSSSVIQRKRQQFQQEPLGEVDEFGKKQRYAMLDTLLSAEAKGQIDHQGICDEVNTFMFAGYDTTSTCLAFTLLMLALNEDIQKRCYEEIQTLPEDGDDISVFQYNELVYLECVIKETLRMFPSAPLIGRTCVEESVVNGLVLPKDTQISIHIYDIMRDPRHFPKPNQFQPERFLPENTVNRHPFAFVPFSAGQRNCIGQKFAILEMKVLLTSVIRNFKLLPATKLEDLTFESGIVLRTTQNIKVKFQKRVRE
ncbi:LOW QUALITY PROTEIN: probable cytochrome P450 4ac2 [Drosophila eugracilis]|uniref:LOW QUALITY PROTEIN: probable cytochrome P450 4ac2 n=1 Tax=Drosophila eugracilis TaxID=29029 RepID=UPI001BDA56DC|nr:LOW QUALITY PROTEIN: probable cytochrome P450 4ac2 [Drosophila eugracilis]